MSPLGSNNILCRPMCLWAFKKFVRSTVKHAQGTCIYILFILILLLHTNTHTHTSLLLVSVFFPLRDSPGLRWVRVRPGTFSLWMHHRCGHLQALRRSEFSRHKQDSRLFHSNRVSNQTCACVLW